MENIRENNNNISTEQLTKGYNDGLFLLQELNYTGYHRKVNEVATHVKNLNRDISFGDYQPNGIVNMFGLGANCEQAKLRSKFIFDVKTELENL